jgi:large subunit ribosomal protein L1
MPNPRAGTVTPDVARAVSDIKGGKVEYRVDRHGNLHLILGKTSFAAKALVENYQVVLDEILRAKPAAAKGRYIKGITIATSMGPGIKVDPSSTRNLTATGA